MLKTRFLTALLASSLLAALTTPGLLQAHPGFTGNTTAVGLHAVGQAGPRGECSQTGNQSQGDPAEGEDQGTQTGHQDACGPSGDQGQTGQSGNQGPSGDQGQTGQSGNQGQAGDQGQTGQ